MDTPGSRSAGRFAATGAAGLAVLLVVGLGSAAVLWLLTGPIAALDRTVAVAVNEWAAPQPLLVAAMEAVTTLGADLAAAVVLTTLAVALLVRRRTLLAIFVVVAGAGGAVIAPALKALVGRLRPVLEAPITTAPGPSFPSGHTLTATLWVGIVLLVLLPAVPTRSRRTVIGAGVAVVLLVGLTRVGLGVHYLSDVVAGWVLGCAWLAVVATAFRHAHRVRGPVASTGVDPAGAADLVPAPEHDPPDARRQVAARVLVVAMLLLGVLLAIGQLVTTVAAGTAAEAADVGLVRTVAGLRTPLLDDLSVPAAELGNTGVVIVGGIVASVLAVAVLRRWRPAVFLVTAIAGETLLFMATASITGRGRPAVPHLDAQLPPTSSFPSGHTAAAVALYGGIAVIVLGATRAWWRWLVLATAVVAVLLVAAARLYRGAHHPSDVLGSLLLTVPWLYALDRLLPQPGSPVRADRTRARVLEP
ncbi:phosphatase PAP2 family protein [Pseudonocardia saturnea]